MNLIYQIGRFDRNFENLVNFKISEKIYQAPLSSFALKEHLGSETETHVKLLYPVSLLLNSEDLKWEFSSEFKEKVKQVLEDPQNYLKNPLEFLKFHPHSKIADTISVLHSIGEFGGIKFSASFDDLVLEIFIEFLSQFFENPFHILYIDISSGHNIYVSALLEAARQFLTFYKLSNWIKENSLKIFVVFSEPIFGAPKGEYEIYFDYELDVKAFFSAPVKIEENDYKFAKTLTSGDRELKRFFQPFFAKAYFFYSIIKNNVPLALYTFSPHSEEEVIDAIKRLLEFTKAQFCKDFKQSPCLNKAEFLKAFFLLSLYLGIIRVLKHYGITQKPELSVKEIEKVFCEENSIYDVFGLFFHKSYLKHELENNFKKEELIEKFQSEWKPLKEFVEGKNLDLQVNPRNFVAHCGFERNCLEVKKEGEEVYLKYSTALIKEQNKTYVDRIREILWKI